MMHLFILGLNLGWANEVAVKAPESKSTTPGTAHETRPLRPTTHPMDTALSEGLLENFPEKYVYVNPEKIVKQLKPHSDAAEGKGTLAIANRTIGWTDIWIGDHKIARLGPLTTGLIHNVKAGTYRVLQTVEHTQYTYAELIKTSSYEKPFAPGNKKADAANKKDYIKPGFDDRSAPVSGKLVPYLMPTAPAPVEEVEENTTPVSPEGTSAPAAE